MEAMIDVGGYQLAARATSGSAPSIVFISGIGESLTVWERHIGLFGAGQATLCYDRAGIGRSQPRPHNVIPLPYSALASELMSLLNGLEVSDPLILIAHSFGTLIARSFAASHPDQVAGMVLIDGAVDDVILWPGSQPGQDGPQPGATLLDYQAGAAELAQARYKPMPAVVLTRTPGRWTSPQADATVDARWSAHQARVAEQLDAYLIVAANAGHRIQDDGPALVQLAIGAVTQAAVRGEASALLQSSDVQTTGGFVVKQPRS